MLAFSLPSTSGFSTSSLVSFGTPRAPECARAAEPVRQDEAVQQANPIFDHSSTAPAPARSPSANSDSRTRSDSLAFPPHLDGATVEPRRAEGEVDLGTCPTGLHHEVCQGKDRYEARGVEGRCEGRDSN